MKHTTANTLSVVSICSLLLLSCRFGSLFASDPAANGFETTTAAFDATTDSILEDEHREALAGDNGQIARRHLEALTGIGARWSGSTEEKETGQYIAGAFEVMGLGFEQQPFTATDEECEEIVSANIIAEKTGASPAVIVVGAHYDSSDEGNGTDDNASGVAVLLETAALISPVTTPYTIYFVTFGAEEAGLFGSQAFVSSLGDNPGSDIVLFVNLDSVSVGDVTYVYSSNGNPPAGNWAVDWAGTHGYALELIPNADLSSEGEATADYAAFDEAGIPWIYFEATNWELGDRDGYTQVDPQYGEDGGIIHTRYDDLAYFDEVFPGRIDQHMNLYVSVLQALLTEYTGR